MIQNYFGEETIWKLLANNPYEKNSAQSITLRYRVTSYQENSELAWNFLNHIPLSNVVEVVREKAPESWKDKEHRDYDVVKQIRVKNVFGCESEVHIINEY